MAVISAMRHRQHLRCMTANTVILLLAVFLNGCFLQEFPHTTVVLDIQAKDDSGQVVFKKLNQYFLQQGFKPSAVNTVASTGSDKIAKTYGITIDRGNGQYYTFSARVYLYASESLLKIYIHEFNYLSGNSMHYRLSERGCEHFRRLLKEIKSVNAVKGFTSSAKQGICIERRD